MNRFSMVAAALATVAWLAACGGPGEEPPVQEATDTVAGATGGMEGMPGMAGMQDGMMEQMQAHMEMMAGMAPDSMMPMVPMHRQMAANMLAQMNRDMEQMDTPADDAWTATVDSLREDLSRMPEMGAQELRDWMPGHRARMTRLMEMHRAMMGNMPR
jgi:hypothetical protein